MSDVIYSFDEVVDITKGVLTKDWLQRNARADRFAHVHVGRRRGLTPEQLADLLARFTRKPEAPARVDLPAVELTSITPRSRARHARAAR